MASHDDEIGSFFLRGPNDLVDWIPQGKLHLDRESLASQIASPLFEILPRPVHCFVLAQGDPFSRFESPLLNAGERKGRKRGDMKKHQTRARELCELARVPEHRVIDEALLQRHE